MSDTDIYEAAAFYRSAALCGETVTGDEYRPAFLDHTDPWINERNVSLGAAALYQFDNKRSWIDASASMKDRYRHMAITMLRVIRVAS